MANAERTEKATPKREREAREKGQVARSKDLTFAVTFLATALYFQFAGLHWLQEMSRSFHLFYRTYFNVEITERTVNELVFVVCTQCLQLAAPLLLIAVSVALFGVMIQGGPVFSAEALSPTFDKLNPAKNVSKIFSSRGAIELVKSTLIISTVVWLAISTLRDSVSRLQMAPAVEVKGVLVMWGNLLQPLSLRLSLMLALFAAADLVFQKYRHAEDLKMTKQEVKEEYKETEGDPLLKGQMRRRQREAASRRMMASVKEADVIVTNPTHFAVALRYDPAEMAAPEVLAKGKDFMALRIKEEAGKHQIPIVEDPPLAKTLYRSVEIGQQIPLEMYRAVAQILAYVYRMKKEGGSFLK